MINDIKLSLASRMNNVLIGGFFTSVMVMNARGIMIFIYSDKAEKINILKNWQLDLNFDILIPLTLSIFYITAIPLLSSAFKKHIANRIYKKEHDAERDWLLIGQSGMREVAIAKAESTPENADLYVKNNIETWIRERSETISKLKEHERNLTLTKNKNGELEKEQNALNEQINYFSHLYDRSVNAVKGFRAIIDELSYPSPKLNATHNFNEMEYKDYIILQLAKNIEHLMKDINASPSVTKNEWNPPIDESMILSLSDYINERENSLTPKSTN